MAKSVVIPRMSLIFLRSKSISQPRTVFFPSMLNSLLLKSHSLHFFSTTSTPYPLQYEMIISRPANPPSPTLKSRQQRFLPKSKPNDSEPLPGSELGFDDWVDRKLNLKSSSPQAEPQPEEPNSEDENNRDKDNELVELKQEVVELPTLHKKEEELYFYDNFAYPWEKDKHYKMVYQLEKKFFPDQGFDKAFLDPGQSNENVNRSKKKLGKKENLIEKDIDGGDGKSLIFFEEEEKSVSSETKKEAKVDVAEKKVEDFFKCLKKVPNKENGVVSAEPFLATRSTGLPPKWDSPGGTVVLVNKPKGWTSFTVCGKLRRLTKVKKVGHAGTLDPMATGLLIVCVGKSTKIVDSYQGMTKGYSGIFRLGEATSTWDADSPINLECVAYFTHTKVSFNHQQHKLRWKDEKFRDKAIMNKVYTLTLVIQREPWEHIKDEDIKKTAASFFGEIWQVPPMFSAIKRHQNFSWVTKVGGEKMYDKARRGESIELAPRRISIFEFDVKRSLDDRQNVIFRVRCSKGTYVRSLCADFGKALGSCAHLTALRRDSIVSPESLACHVYIREVCIAACEQIVVRVYNNISSVNSKQA
uniref:tRNA pseudouridine(55) synthase n=1 Tax=Solanum lycopersicum TaxID=4081 RepID=A0A3Q7FDR6_SOLLC